VTGERGEGLHVAVDARLAALADSDFAARLWAADATLWKADEPRHQEVIENSLGWLSVFEDVREEVADLEAFVADLREDGFRHAVLLGMGGSSLAPEVMFFALGLQAGYLDLTVLDTTDPAAIAAVEARVDLAATLFIVASKSGGTTETASLHAYFYDRMLAVAGDGRAGRHFIAVTDEDTALERQALDQDFRAIFLNPSDIGGRYSALSFFGLVPAALFGADLQRLLDRAQFMADDCGPEVEAGENKGLMFGAWLGELARSGRDKLTLVASPAIGNFGSWVEQLVAESTGKEGKGLFPVDVEPLGPPEVYGDDRAFVYMRLDEGFDPAQDEALEALEEAGFPVVRLALDDAYDIGGQFILWEIAVSAAGAIIGIDPFDQPNVQESKDNTRRVLDELEELGEVPLPAGAGGEAVAFAVGDDGLEPALRSLLADLAPPSYVALQAWVMPGNEAWLELQAMREALRDARRVATSEGFGPRFLHSTGQYHKGGPAHGVFLQLYAHGGPELPVPGAGYSFATLKKAQALGDLEALLVHGGRVLRVDLGEETVEGLRMFRQLLEATLAGR
jgi:glucose-6-phosphate isomerase